MMIIFQLAENHPFIANLNEMLEWVKNSDVPSRVAGDIAREDLSEECLAKRISGEIKTNFCRSARFDVHKGFDFSKIEKEAANIYQEKVGLKIFEQISVAKTWYPPKEGYIGWHIDDYGDRLYATFADGKSFFRYLDPEKKEIITSWDEPNAWTFRIFNFDAKNPMWHCVKSYDLRVSVGYRFIS